MEKQDQLLFVTSIKLVFLTWTCSLTLNEDLFLHLNFPVVDMSLKCSVLQKEINAFSV